MKSAHEGLWEWDLTNDKVFFDKVALGMLGFSSENISDDMKKGSWWMQQVHPDDKEEMQKRFNQYISGELDEYVSEFRLKNKDGGYTWIYSSGLIIDHDENGKSKGIIGIHRDITERKRIEKQIKESETRYRSLFENMGNAVAVYKAVDNGNDFIFVDFNKTAEKTEKISKEDLIGKRVTEVFPGVKEFGLLDVLKEVWKSGNAKELPASYYQDSNITGWRKSFVYKLPTDEIIAVYDDITNRIEMINAIREAKERLDILFEYAPDAIYLLDSNGVFLQWNKTAEMITGYSRREAIGKKFTDLKLVQRKYLPKALKNLAKSKLGFPTGPDEYELIKKDGSSVFTEISTYPVNIKNETVIMGIARDITKRLESERLLEENEARYRMLFNSSNDAIFLIDQNETIVDCNIKASEMFNFKKRSIINNTLHDFFLRTQADGQSLYDIVERRISDVFDGKEQKFEWVQKNNRSETFYADVQLNRIFINDRFIVQAVITDTTNMKKKQKIENRLASIVRYTEDAIISKNLDGMITSWNRGAELLYGYKQDEVIGRYISLIVPENKMDELHKIMRTAKEGKILSNFETKRKRKNGSLIDVSLTISPIKDKKGTVTGISSIGHNITDRKITTKKLRETRDKLKEMNENLEKIVEDRTKQVNQLLEQKDEYIRMLGHDLKNPLGPLLNLLPIVRNKVDDKDVKKMIDISLNNVNKLKKLLYHTIEQAKKDSLGLDLNLEEIQLSSIVNNVIESRRQFFTSLEFKILNHVDDSFIVMTDKIRLTEVFDNLISNSIKYSNGKNPEIIIDAVVEETHLKVSVSDNGRGIASEDLDHVFDQFYHKGSSNGILESHGLGLAICRKIIEKHGGSIWVESEGFGKGSTFYFTLPIPEKKEKRIINEHHRTS
jgi:PAS domain S-box-containing protein